MNFCIISGSSREDNNTLRLSKATEREIKELGYKQVSIIDFRGYDFPFFNGGYLERSNLTSFQKNTIDAMAKADVIIIYSPEYNWFPSAEVVNLIHQTASHGNSDLYNEKVFVFGGVSSGRGGKIPAIQLSTVVGKVINFLDLSSIVSSKIFESSFTQDNINESGEVVTEDTYKEEFMKFIKYSIKLGERWKENS